MNPLRTTCSRTENAIRRMAGIMVLGSLALGYWVTPAWFLLTAFVGLNLLQSSFTGICPVEPVIRKLVGEKPADLETGKAMG
jgi:hypothetical protein